MWSRRLWSKPPTDSVVVLGVRAAPGQMPAGGVGAKTVVTSRVVGVDVAGHSLQLVDPSGGLVRNVDVVTPEGQQGLKLVKVGDTLTGVVSSAIAVAVEPAA